MLSVYCIIDPFASWGALASFDGLEDETVDVWRALFSLHPVIEKLGGPRRAADGETLIAGSFWPRQSEAHARLWFDDLTSFKSDPIDEALENGGLLWLSSGVTHPGLSGGFSLSTRGNPPSFQSWRPWSPDTVGGEAEVTRLVGAGRLYVAASNIPSLPVMVGAGVSPPEQPSPDAVINPIVVRLSWDEGYICPPTEVYRFRQLLKRLLRPDFLLDIMVETDEFFAARAMLASHSRSDGAPAIRRLWNQNKKGPKGLATLILDMFGGCFEIENFGFGQTAAKLGWRPPATWREPEKDLPDKADLSRALSTACREWANISLLEETRTDPIVLPSGVEDRIALTLTKRPVSVARARRELNLDPPSTTRISPHQTSWLNALLSPDSPFPKTLSFLTASIVSAAENIRAAQEFWSTVYAVLGPQSQLLLRLPGPPNIAVAHSATWRGIALDVARSAPLGTKLTLIALYDRTETVEAEVWSWRPHLGTWLRSYYEGLLRASIDSAIVWSEGNSARLGSLVLGASHIGAEVSVPYLSESISDENCRIY